MIFVKRFGEINPYMNKIISEKIIPKSQYFLSKDGVKKIKKGSGDQLLANKRHFY